MQHGTASDKHKYPACYVGTLSQEVITL